MALLSLRENQTWEQARIEAQRAGIVLTRRPHKKGGFFCYAGKKLRQINKPFAYETNDPIAL